MYNIKTLLAAASMAVAMAAGASSANAAPWDRQMDRHMPIHRNFVVHERVVEVLRAHHYRFMADPVFVRGHYVVKSSDRFGHIVFVEIDPYSGAFIGRFRV